MHLNWEAQHSSKSHMHQHWESQHGSRPYMHQNWDAQPRSNQSYPRQPGYVHGQPGCDPVMARSHRPAPYNANSSRKNTNKRRNTTPKKFTGKRNWRPSILSSQILELTHHNKVSITDKEIDPKQVMNVITQINNDLQCTRGSSCSIIDSDSNDMANEHTDDYLPDAKNNNKLCVTEKDHNHKLAMNKSPVNNVLPYLEGSNRPRIKSDCSDLGSEGTVDFCSLVECDIDSSEEVTQMNESVDGVDPKIEHVDPGNILCINSISKPENNERENGRGIVSDSKLDNFYDESTDKFENKKYDVSPKSSNGESKGDFDNDNIPPIKRLKSNPYRESKYKTNKHNAIQTKILSLCSYVIQDEVTDYCPVGHSLRKCYSTVNVKTEVISVFCKRCKIMIYMG